MGGLRDDGAGYGEEDLNDYYSNAIKAKLEFLAEI